MRARAEQFASHLSAVAEEKHAIEHADGDLTNLTSRRVMRLDRLKLSNKALKGTQVRQRTEMVELKLKIGQAKEKLRREEEKAQQLQQSHTMGETKEADATAAVEPAPEEAAAPAEDAPAE